MFSNSMQTMGNMVGGSVGRIGHAIQHTLVGNPMLSGEANHYSGESIAPYTTQDFLLPKIQGKAGTASDPRESCKMFNVRVNEAKGEIFQYNKKDLTKCKIRVKVWGEKLDYIDRCILKLGNGTDYLEITLYAASGSMIQDYCEQRVFSAIRVKLNNQDINMDRSTIPKVPPRPFVSAPPSPMSKTIAPEGWYFATTDNREFGPCTLSKLKEEYEKGSLNDSCYVWNEKVTNNEWKTIGLIPELMEELQFQKIKKPPPRTHTSDQSQVDESDPLFLILKNDIKLGTQAARDVMRKFLSIGVTGEGPLKHLTKSELEALNLPPPQQRPILHWIAQQNMAIADIVPDDAFADTGSWFAASTTGTINSESYHCNSSQNVEEFHKALNQPTAPMELGGDSNIIQMDIKNSLVFCEAANKVVLKQSINDIDQYLSGKREVGECSFLMFAVSSHSRQPHVLVEDTRNSAVYVALPSLIPLDEILEKPTEISSGYLTGSTANNKLLQRAEALSLISIFKVFYERWQKLERNDTFRFIVTGYYIGGAIANMAVASLAMHLGGDFGKNATVCSITFGAPHWIDKLPQEIRGIPRLFNNILFADDSSAQLFNLINRTNSLPDSQSKIRARMEKQHGEDYEVLLLGEIVRLNPTIRSIDRGILVPHGDFYFLPAKSASSSKRFPWVSLENLSLNQGRFSEYANSIASYFKSV